MFQYTVSQEKADPRPIHNLSIMPKLYVKAVNQTQASQKLG